MTDVLTTVAMWVLEGLGLVMLIMMASLPLLEWLAQGPETGRLSR